MPDMSRFHFRNKFDAQLVYDGSFYRAEKTAGDNAQQIIHDYFVRTLSAPSSKAVAKRGLEMSQLFFTETRKDYPAHVVRQAFQSALAQTCPAFERARLAIVDLHTLGCIIGSLGNIFDTVLAKLSPSLSTEHAKRNFSSTKDSVCELWSQMCVDERASLRWAEYGNAKALEGLVQITKLHEDPCDKAIQNIRRQPYASLLTHVQAMTPPPLSAEERICLKTCQRYLKASHKKSIQSHFAQRIKPYCDRALAPSLWILTCRMHIDALRDVNLDALIAAFKAPTGRSYLRAKNKLQKFATADKEIVVRRAWNIRFDTEPEIFLEQAIRGAGAASYDEAVCLPS